MKRGLLFLEATLSCVWPRGATRATERVAPRREAVFERYLRSNETRTQLDVANALGISVGRVSALERHARNKVEDLTEARRILAARRTLEKQRRQTQRATIPPNETTGSKASSSSGRRPTRSEPRAYRRRNKPLAYWYGAVARSAAIGASQETSDSVFFLRKRRRRHYKIDALPSLEDDLEFFDSDFYDSESERLTSKSVSLSRGDAERELLMRKLVKEVGYFYFRDDLGLPDERLALVASRHGTVLSQRRDTLRAKGDALRDALELDDATFRNLAARQPSLLGQATATLERKMIGLERCYGVSRAQVGAAVAREPKLLTASLQNVLEPVAATLDAWLAQRDSADDDDDDETGETDDEDDDQASSKSNTLRLSSDLASIFVRAPGVATSRRIGDTIAVFESRLGRAEALRAARRVPEILALGPDHAASRFDALDAHLDRQHGLTSDFAEKKKKKKPDPRKVRRTGAGVVAKWPRALCYTPRRVDAAVSRLRDRLGAELDVGAVVFRSPSVIGLGDASVDESIDFLDSLLGGDADTLRKVVEARPQALGLSVARVLRPRLHWLATALPDLDLGALVAKFPTLLGLDVDANLGPKLDLLREYARRDLVGRHDPPPDSLFFAEKTKKNDHDDDDDDDVLPGDGNDADDDVVVIGDDVVARLAAEDDEDDEDEDDDDDDDDDEEEAHVSSAAAFDAPVDASSEEEIRVCRAVAEIVSNCPALLGYSLERRIRPRLHTLLDVHRLPFRSLTAYITLSDAAFERKLADRLATRGNDLGLSETDHQSSKKRRRRRQETLGQIST